FIKNWKFIQMKLTGQNLQIYDGPKIETIDLRDSKLLISKSNLLIFSIIPKFGRKITLKAQDEKEKVEWLTYLKNASTSGSNLEIQLKESLEFSNETSTSVSTLFLASNGLL